MTVHTLQVNGTRGEITPLMQARVDTDFYQAGFAIARNVSVTRYGAMTRTPGTIFNGLAKINAKKARILPFEFSEEQVYALEFGDKYIRFWTPEGQVVGPGPGFAIYEVASPYDANDLDPLHLVQSGDAVYIFCKGYRPQVLKRMSELNWTLTPYQPKDGPYLAINESSTTLRANSYNSVIRDPMTTNAGPTGTASTADGSGTAWRIFDKNASSDGQLAAGTNGWVKYDCTGGPRSCDMYWLQASSDPETASDRTPRSWILQGSNDDINWTPLDSQDGQTGWAPSEKRFFPCPNKIAFLHFRLLFSGGGTDHTSIAELGLNESVLTQPVFEIIASSTTGINDNAGFKSTDIGRSIRLLGSDGRWRWAEIKSVTDTTHVVVNIYGHAFPDISIIVTWALGAWSDTIGWPYTGVLYEDRLITAGSDNDPVGLWASINAGYDSYRTSTPAVADDGFSLRLTGGRMNPIRWLVESGALLAGTGGSLRSVGSRDNSSGALAADNVRQRAETSVGASAVQPSSVENVTLFMDRANKRMYEAAYDFQADGYVAREVSTLNEHLFSVGILQIAYVSSPHKIMYCRRSDGKVTAFAYDREQKVVGGTLLDFGGYVEDLMSMVGRNGVDLWLVVRRVVNGVTLRYIERLANFYRADDPSTGLPVYAACSSIYNGAPTTTLTGMGFMEGSTLGVWADGRDIGDAVVTGGSLVLPFGLSGSKIVVGLRMEWSLQTLRLSQIGNQDGSGLGRNVRIVSAMVDLFETAGVDAGTLSEIYPLEFEDAVEEDPDEPTTLRTGMYKLPTDDSWQNCGVFAIEGDRMYPATIRGISLEVDGEP